MNRILALLMFVSLSSVAIARTEIVDTEFYQFEISIPCVNIHESCQHIDAVLTNKKTGVTEKLFGREKYTVCADGKSACYFEGYQLMGAGYFFSIDAQSELRISLHPLP